MPKTLQDYSIYLLTGNTRIGGAQRILIDEYYELISRNASAKIISLSQTIENDEILTVDRNFILANRVEIQFAGEGKINQIRFLIQEFKNSPKKVHVISHDFSGVLISRVAGILCLKKITIDLYIHQLLDLSDSRQRQKRIILSLLASNLFASSIQFKHSWENYLKKSLIWKFIYKKSIKFDRMGIFIPRIINQNFLKNQVCEKQIPHVIFMSRITAWKGFSVFSRFCENHVNHSMHSIVITTKNGRPEIFNESSFIDEFNHVIYESGVGNLSFPSGSVHLYPTNYGTGVAYPQSIGMNVLELLAVGIPSIISPEGFMSWPELEKSPLIATNSWIEDSQLESSVRELSTLPTELINKEIKKLIPTISISNHIDRIYQRLTA